MSSNKIKTGNIIPYGVNTINFTYSGMNLPFSELPITVNTIKNVYFGIPCTYSSYYRSDDMGYEYEDYIQTPMDSKDYNIDYNIPSNITSISFTGPKTNISNVGVDCIKLPSTIKELQFDDSWNNDGIELNIGDLPESLTKLSMQGYYSFKEKCIIPISVNHLSISFNNFNNTFDFLNVLPSNVKTLNLNTWYGITNKLNLFKFDSITTLNIQIYGKKPSPSSFPPNLTDLSISGIKGSIQPNTIPNGVKYLKILFQYPQFETNFISNKSIPSSVVTFTINKCICLFSSVLVDPKNTLLNHLEIKYNRDGYNHNELIQLASNLPLSLTSISLPDQIKSFNIKFNENIKKINYIPIV